MCVDTRNPGYAGNGTNLEINLPHLMYDSRSNAGYLFVAPLGTVGRESKDQAFGTRIVDFDQDGSIIGIEFLARGEFVDAQLDGKSTDGIPEFDLREFPTGKGAPSVEEVVLLLNEHGVSALVD